jgi:hypothetical protein
MFDKLKKLFVANNTTESVPIPAPVENTVKDKSAKDHATDNGEPYVAVLSVDIDKNNVGNGSFELDWNDIFVARLVKAGYRGTTDQQIVDQWFQTVCRNIVLETFEQDQADPDRRVLSKKRLDQDRTEFS